MNKNGLNKFFWGFIFIMLSFRIQGIDILPDIVGYLFLASGFNDLSSESPYFNTASKYNIPMIILSLLSIYQPPAQGGGIHFGILGMLSIPLAIVSFILNLLIVYNLFMGIKDMAERRGQIGLAEESNEKWNQYKLLQIAVLLGLVLVFIPVIGLIYILGIFIASIIVAVSILSFLRRCSNELD